MISVKFSELKSTLISSEIVKISFDSIDVLFILEGCWNINETRVLVCSVVVLLLLKMFIHIFTPTTCVIVTRKELLQLFISSVIFQQNNIVKHGGNREC